ncbi:efflux RND transporter permease subunit [Salmonella enterica subsp. enterica serovar Kentucky]|nr:efflux RND transporter permease subunit [Salmonella enterica subsp. enterica serovar Kentucky]
MLAGLQGEFYRQFALTIAISTILSAINSLTLSCAGRHFAKTAPRYCEG